MELRIGHGYDIHRTAPDRRLILGGVEIPAEFGLDGHSDADVLLHAISDAMLGAVSAGDIGQWFPDTDTRWRGADSMTLLQRILGSPELAPWRAVNVDCTVVAERPRLAEHIQAIRRRIASLLGTPERNVSVKATTNEGLDAVGRGEAIAAHAVALLSTRGSSAESVGSPSSDFR